MKLVFKHKNVMLFRKAKMRVNGVPIYTFDGVIWYDIVEAMQIVKKLTK